jgi:hypothetical protein
VDGLACPLHHPMTCRRQTRGQGFLLGAVLSHHAAVGGGALLGDGEPPGVDIRWSFDRFSTCTTEFYIW